MVKPISNLPLRIGIFVPNDFEYVPRLVDGILQYQIDHGGFLIREYRYDSKATEDQVAWAKRISPWEDWQPHGLITGISMDPGVPEWVAASGTPVVNTSSSSTHFPSVHLSFDGIARVAVEHFQPLGFKNYASVACDPGDRRAAAFERRLKDKGFALRVFNFGRNPAHYDDEIETQMAKTPELLEMLREMPKPLAVLAANDHVGRVVCRAANLLGLRIPREVGILGINNFSICRGCAPPLSSIHAPGDKVGYRAMELLMGIINGQPAPHRTEIDPVRVQARESTVGKDKQDDVARALELIRERACDGIRVEQIMEELNISRSTLYREFAAMIGRTPAEEISRIRLARAIELLSKTKVPLTKIAGRLGYANPPAFTDFFKNQMGMTPRAYRKKHGKGRPG